MDMNYGGECGREGGGQDGVEWGGEWDNCNSIINKYILKNPKYAIHVFYVIGFTFKSKFLNLLKVDVNSNSYFLFTSYCQTKFVVDFAIGLYLPLPPTR